MSDLAESLYLEGMKYNWRSSESPSSSAVSRAALERAAALGYTKAIREVSEMIFAGSGGPKDQEHALWLKWSAFSRGDHDALEDLSTLLEVYAESLPDASSRARAAEVAQKAEKLNELTEYVGSYLQELFRVKRINSAGESAL